MGNFFSSLFGNKEARKSEESKIPEEAPKKEEENIPEAGEKEETADTKPDVATDGHAYARELLQAQNKYRSKHGVDPMTLNTQMCEEAQKWADHLASKNIMQHSKTTHGENLAMAMPKLEAQKAADMWYDEVQNYDFGNPGFSSGTGHFTQVVWKGSKEFGCGRAKSGGGNVYVVGRYEPAGNMRGDYETNVFQAK